MNAVIKRTAFYVYLKLLFFYAIYAIFTIDRQLNLPFMQCLPPSTRPRHQAVIKTENSA